MRDFCNSIEEYHPVKDKKLLTMFDEMIADMNSKKNHPVVIELFIMGRKLSVSLLFSHDHSLGYQVMQNYSS